MGFPFEETIIKKIGSTFKNVEVGIGLLFYNQFLAVCFDREFARLRGMKVELFYLLLLCLAGLTVVVLVTVVGIVMVIALLTLPIGIAGLLSTTIWRMMVISAILMHHLHHIRVGVEL